MSRRSRPVLGLVRLAGSLDLSLELVGATTGLEVVGGHVADPIVRLERIVLPAAVGVGVGRCMRPMRRVLTMPPRRPQVLDGA